VIGVGIIGCGLIGTKRANAIGAGGRLVACADIDYGRAQNLAAEKARAFESWRELISYPQVDAVIVATLHDSLSEITRRAVEAGKHVLVEKPAARNISELEPLLSVAESSKVVVRVGFNHRYHRAIRKAKELVDQRKLGELMFIRARYGHGGRVGYDREWRADYKLSGGGELLDQGPHLIDLSRWFFKTEISEISGIAQTCYWDMPVDDNAFMLLKTNGGQVAFLHVSCTEWKNLFSMEIYGKDGKLEINGLGGSYGTEQLTWYKMLPEMGPPETFCWQFPMKDNSWNVELDEFFEDIRLGRAPSASLLDAREALKVIQEIYRKSGYDYRS
jgi:predicted dehydrogenase